MQTELTAPIPVVIGRYDAAVPLPLTIRPRDPSAAPRPRVVVVVLVLLLVVGLGAAGAAVALRMSAPDPVAAALDQLRGWPAISVDGYLTGGGDPTHLVATTTADGATRGTVTRSRAARAEFVAGPGGTLLRGNVQWWIDAQPEQAVLLAGRWVRDPQDDVIDLVARGRLTPVALADALADLREPAQRTRAEVVVDGTPGISFVRAGSRLVVTHDGRPLSLTARLTTAPGTVIRFRSGPASAATVPAYRAGPALGSPPAASWTATLAVALPAPADADAVRTTAAALAAQVGDHDPTGPAPSGSEGSAPDAAPAHPASLVAIDGRPDPSGCRPASCTMRYRLTNRDAAAVTGLFTVRVDDTQVVTARVLTLPPHGSTLRAVPIPAPVLSAHPNRALKLEARFTPLGSV